MTMVPPKGLLVLEVPECGPVIRAVAGHAGHHPRTLVLLNRYGR